MISTTVSVKRNTLIIRWRRAHGKAQTMRHDRI